MKFDPDGIGVIYVEYAANPVGIGHSDRIGTPAGIGMFPYVKISFDVVFQWCALPIGTGHRFGSTIPPMHNQTVPINMAGGLGISNDGDSNGEIADLFIGNFPCPVVCGQNQRPCYDNQTQGQYRAYYHFHILNKDTIKYENTKLQVTPGVIGWIVLSPVIQVQVFPAFQCFVLPFSRLIVQVGHRSC